MNTSAFHITDDRLESYTLGFSSERESECIEEHVLVCLECQKRLQDVDEFVQIIAAALAEPSDDPPAARSRRIQLRFLSGAFEPAM